MLCLLTCRREAMIKTRFKDNETKELATFHFYAMNRQPILWQFHVRLITDEALLDSAVIRAVAGAIMGGGGGEGSYMRVLLDEFLMKFIVLTVDLKRNSSRRTHTLEYSLPPPHINCHSRYGPGFYTLL